MKSFTVAALVALLLVCGTLAAKPVCHNITGTCLAHGFECVSGEVVPHAQRCDGIEQCSDGTDELLCEHDDHRPLAERTAEEREAVQQASCVNCNCVATAYAIGTSSNWWQYAITSPTDVHLMTQGNGRPCHSGCTLTMMMGFYRKNRICRGWLCCARQRQCLTCTTGSAPCNAGSTEANHCVPT